MNSVSLWSRLSANENKACWCKEGNVLKKLSTNELFRVSLVVDIIDI